MLRHTSILSSHAGKNWNSWYCFLTYSSPNQNDTVDRKKSIMRTFQVESACGEDQLGMFTRLRFTCYRQLTAVGLISLIS